MVTGPVVAPGGTIAAMLDVPQLVIVAGTPLNVNTLSLCVAPKPAPVTVTGWPIGPDDEERAVIES